MFSMLERQTLRPQAIINMKNVFNYCKIQSKPIPNEQANFPVFCTIGKLRD